MGLLLAQSARHPATFTPSTASETGWCMSTSSRGITDFEAIDRDWAIRTILGVGEISNTSCSARKTGSDAAWSPTSSRRHVFICGDACHLWVPYAGYGMNAGIADAANLSGCWRRASTAGAAKEFSRL